MITHTNKGVRIGRFLPVRAPFFVFRALRGVKGGETC